MRWIVMMLLFFSPMCFGEQNLKLLIGHNAIANRIKLVATKIDREYRGEELTIIMIMKGALCVTADLIRNLHTPTRLEYVQAKSYGEHEPSKGKIKLDGLDNINITGRNVLIVDDICDSGSTMKLIISHLQAKKPKSLKSLVLFSKKNSKKSFYRPNYVLFRMDEVMSKFPKGSKKDQILVGYGIDHNEYLRGLPGIYVYAE